jgi:Ca2+/Na+ antiporter
MNDYRLIATVSVGRAVMFATLAIVMMMMGMAFDFALSLKVGAVLTLAMSAILLWFALTIARRRVETTETWLLLDDDAKPRNDEARSVLKTALKDIYLQFSMRAWIASVSMFAGSSLMAVMGVEAGFG